MPNLRQPPNFLTVPWYSSEEWKRVFKLIFKQNDDVTCRKEALQILLVWKTRCPALPSAIESTLGLLEVELQDAVDTTDSDANTRLTRLMYSSVIMRFINHTLDDSQCKRLSLVQAADQMKIPQWVVNLRHETAHGYELPALSLLKNAAKFALNWLYTLYWSPYNSSILDVITEERTSYNEFENDLSELISLHNLLAVLSHPTFNIARVGDIGDSDMRESVISDLKYKNIDCKSELIANVKIKTAFKGVVKNINKLLMNCHHSSRKDEIFAKVMVGPESLFLTTNNQISGDVSKQNKLSKDFAQIWEPILTVLHSHDMITTLVRHLIDIVEDNEESPQKRLGSALWVKEIAVALFKSKLIIFIPNLFLGNSSTKKKHLYSSLVNKYPKQTQGLTLSLSHPVPQTLSNPEFTDRLFENYTPYLSVYIEPMLQLREPALPETALQKSLELIRIMSSKTINVTCERIYTLYDITNKKEAISNEELEIQVTNDNGSECSMETDQSVNVLTSDSHINLGKWQKASTEFDWGKYPIGVLPWQMNDSLLP